MDAKTVFKNTADSLTAQGFNIVKMDDRRPWGGFFVIDEAQALQFIEAFFPGLSLQDFEGFKKLSPKVLVVAPGSRLSWQYHFRRSEIWRLLEGEAGLIVSPTDEEGPLQRIAPGELVRLEQGERHRLVGLEDWGVLAEIWRHTDPAHPSDEDDIVRVQDDYGR